MVPNGSVERFHSPNNQITFGVAIRRTNHYSTLRIVDPLMTYCGFVSCIVYCVFFLKRYDLEYSGYIIIAKLKKISETVGPQIAQG